MPPSNSMGFFAPCYPLQTLASPSFDIAATLAAANDKFAVVFMVPKTGSISSLSFYVGTVTGTHTLSIGLYTVDSAGDPTTTAYGGMTAGTVSATGAFVNKTVSLGTSATATKGDIVAAVISYSSYGGTGSTPIVGMTNAVHNSNFPYGDYFNGTSWARKVAYRFALGVFYNDSTAPLTPAFDSAYTTSVSLISTQKSGNVFVPSEACEVYGIMANVTLASTDTFQYFVETQTDKTRLQTHSIGNGITSPTAGSNKWLFLPFTPAVRLVAGTSYVIGMENTGANSWTMSLNTGEDNSFVWFEQAANLTTFANALRTTGIWTITDHDYRLVFPLIRPI